MTEDYFANNNIQSKLFSIYLKVLGNVCKAEGIDINSIIPSRMGIHTAFRDARLDIKALTMRRPLKKGISKGKIAGILAFRLSKANTFSLTPKVVDHPAIQHLAANSALLIAFELADINYKDWPSFIQRELKYFLIRRHSNQESISLCFDIMANSYPKAPNHAANQTEV